MREIKLAGAEHAQAIARLEERTFSHPCGEASILTFCKSDNAFCAACFMDGILASYCTVMTVLDEAQIINVATDEAYKNKGCAKDVISFVLKEAKHRDIRFFSLEVRESNVPAISLYKSFGFEIAGKRKDFYTDPRENALVMTKNLD